jgi:hypothetical protein
MDDQLSQGRYVVLHIGVGPSRAEVESGPPLVVTGTDRFRLTDDIWIERLNEQLATRIQTACEPPHYKTNILPQDRHLYAFLRRVSGTETSKYEGMAELYTVLSLSRLIRPTSADDRYSALVVDAGLEDSAIHSIQFRGISPDVFVSSKQRDWLSVEDGENLRKLMPWLSKSKRMHDRVRRAFWNHEYAMRSLYLDMRWPLVVSGLEALVNVGNKDNKWQFRDRVRQLVSKFGVGLTDDDLSRAYDLRSKLLHTESFLYALGTILPQSQHNELYEKLEDLLRVTVKQCLFDENFGSFFRDDHAVAARWPLGSKPTK